MTTTITSLTSYLERYDLQKKLPHIVGLRLTALCAFQYYDYVFLSKQKITGTGWTPKIEQRLTSFCVRNLKNGSPRLETSFVGFVIKLRSLSHLSSQFIAHLWTEKVSALSYDKYQINMVHPNANYHRYQDFEVTLAAVNKQSTLVHSSPCCYPIP